MNPSILPLRNLLARLANALAHRPGYDQSHGDHEPLADKDIVIGKCTGDPARYRRLPLTPSTRRLLGNCPLWTYVLAETVKTNVTIKTTPGDKKIETPKTRPGRRQNRRRDLPRNPPR